MNVEAPKPALGWAFPHQDARKVHFFDEGRSLCGRWAYLGALRPRRFFAGFERCKACQGKLS